VLQVKTGSRHADEASCAGGQAQEATILCNDGEGGSLAGSGGKLLWAPGRIFIWGELHLTRAEGVSIPSGFGFEPVYDFVGSQFGSIRWG
jgi:hypothetical protein